MLKDQNASYQFLPATAGLASVFASWEYSLPGLRHYSQEEWCRVDPLIATKLGRIDLVLEHAKKVWSELH